MTSQAAPFETVASVQPAALRLGRWASILMAISAAVALGLGIVTPVRAGPFCPGPACITYPYTDAAAFVARDSYWMYPALLMVLLFVVVVACIHRSAVLDRQVFSQVAFAFAIISAAVLALDYFIQLAAMQPSLAAGEVEGLALFSMYNPHGVFIAMEDLGYLAMSAGFLFAAFVFTGRARLARAIRWTYVIGFVLTAGAFVMLVLRYGLGLEYRFEVAAILFTWLTLIVSGILLGFRFGRRN